MQRSAISQSENVAKFELVHIRACMLPNSNSINSTLLILQCTILSMWQYFAWVYPLTFANKIDLRQHKNKIIRFETNISAALCMSSLCKVMYL